MTESVEERVVAVYTRLLEAWNSQDADAFAALFEADGNSVGFDGSPLNGRDEIASSLRAIFADHRTASYVARVREMRQLSRDVILLRAVAGMVKPGETTLMPERHAIQSVVLVDHEDQLGIALLHNTPAAFHGRPHLVEELTRELDLVRRSGRVVANK